MGEQFRRREFLHLTLAGAAIGFGVRGQQASAGIALPTTQISPGCRRSKVKVARLYLGSPEGLWPKPHLNFEDEIRSYQSAFDAMKDEFRDVEFVVDRLVTSPEQAREVRRELAGVDGVLIIHLSIGIQPTLTEVLIAGRPTTLFAAPYSGHEWAGFGALQKQPAGANLECLLTSDRRQLAAAIRPFRAIHHLREAKVLNLTTRSFAEYADAVRNKFGTEIKPIDLPRVLTACNAVSENDAKAEAERWIREAVQVVEPPHEDIVKSARLALAFEKLLDEEDATVLTVDCYGTMWDRTIKLPAYPCLGFARLNSLGWGGICESDLPSGMTHILFQGLTGKPGFISDPTMDESRNGIILAHCMGTPKMDGPDNPPAPYKLRTVMERQEGVVPQVSMRLGERVTQALLEGTDQLLYFTGEVIEAPETDRGCRTKITVKLDGSAEKLWKNWSAGLHRVTCYGDVTKDLERFCRFKQIKLINEAV